MAVLYAICLAIVSWIKERSTSSAKRTIFSMLRRLRSALLANCLQFEDGGLVSVSVRAVLSPHEEAERMELEIFPKWLSDVEFSLAAAVSFWVS